MFRHGCPPGDGTGDPFLAGLGQAAWHEGGHGPQDHGFGPSISPYIKHSLSYPLAPVMPTAASSSMAAAARAAVAAAGSWSSRADGPLPS